LVEAGIMEPDGDGFGFTAEAWARREELLREAEDRIERERSDPPDTINLSDAAMALLRQSVVVCVNVRPREVGGQVRQPRSGFELVEEIFEFAVRERGSLARVET
jgi:hypothetical protein